MEQLRRTLEARRARRAAGDECPPACLVTVIRTAGSTPRHPGAMMVVESDGTTFGTIGGGRVELEVTERGRQVAEDGDAVRIEHHLVRDLGMCCGGSMEFLLAPLSRAEDALRGAFEIARSRGVAELRLRLIDGAATVSDVESSDEPTSQLTEDELILAWRPRERALLFGLGHVSSALGPWLGELGFDVIVCDDNETGAVESNPGWAGSVISSFDVRDVVREIGGLGASDYALVLTRDHAIDLKVLEELLQHPVGYLGLIASRRKVETFRKRLLAKGTLDEEKWRAVHAPIGFDIGAETPAEIAAAIAAEMVGHRHRRTGPR